MGVLRRYECCTLYTLRCIDFVHTLCSDDVAELSRWTGLADGIVSQLSSVHGISARVVCPGPPDIQPSHIPRVYVDIVDERLALHLFSPAASVAAGRAVQPIGGAHAPICAGSVDHSDPLRPALTSAQAALAAALADGTPTIALNTSASGIVINPQTLTDEEARIVACRIAEVVQQCHRDIGISEAAQ